MTVAQLINKRHIRPVAKALTPNSASRNDTEQGPNRAMNPRHPLIGYTFSFAPSQSLFIRSSVMASSAISYARENQQRFLNELKDLLRIPSVSTAEEHKSDVVKAAHVVADDLKRIGFEHVEIIPTEGHPLVYADWLHAAGKPTALCYAH